MMKMLIPLALGSSLLSQAQQLPRNTATPQHFRWSEDEAHELEYSHTIRTTTDLSHAEKVNLTNAILLQMKRDAKLSDLLEDLTDRQLRSLAEDTRIELVDLNGDGTPEIIAQANGLGPCGGSGNCVFWVFQRTPDGLKVVLDTEERSQVTFEKILIRPWSTNGYRDIVLGSHVNASDRNLVWFQFARGKYRIHACYYSTWMGYGAQPLKAPAIWRTNCSESIGDVH